MKVIFLLENINATAWNCTINQKCEKTKMMYITEYLGSQNEHWY